MAFGSGSKRYDTSVHGSSPEARSGPDYIPNPSISRLWGAFQTYPAFHTLTPSQKRFAELFFQGRNLGLSGSAGVGKSYLINVLFAFLQEHKVSVARIAMTGIAAFNIGGQTMHSWLGIGLGDEDAESLIVKVRKKSKVKDRIKATQILFIDEISMCKAELLDKANLVIQAIRYNIAPFGGMQVCASFDFLQLPPVWKGEETKQFAFNAQSWKNACIKTVVLKEVVRQSDTEFVRLLNGIRVGDTRDLSLLEPRIDATFPADGIEPVRIYCRNVDVNRVNKERLDQIPSPVKTFISIDNGLPYHIESFNKNCPAPAILELKIGAQVMCLANIDVSQGICNGAIGVITAFGPPGVTVKFKEATAIIDHNVWEIKEQEATLDGKLRYKIVATRTQIPLRCCWAVTVHKVQGMTLDRAIIDMSEAFVEGQSYVALSRCRDLESISITSLPKSAIRVNSECISFYKALEEDSCNDTQKIGFAKT